MAPGPKSPSNLGVACHLLSPRRVIHPLKNPPNTSTKNLSRSKLGNKCIFSEDVTQVATVDGNQKSGKLTSWWKRSEKFPLFTRVLAPSKRWLGMGFLNHQQYDTYPPKFNMEPENYLLEKEEHLPKPAFVDIHIGSYISLGFLLFLRLPKRWRKPLILPIHPPFYPTCGAVDPSVVIVTGDSIR